MFRLHSTLIFLCTVILFFSGSKVQRILAGWLQTEPGQVLWWDEVSLARGNLDYLEPNYAVSWEDQRGVSCAWGTWSLKKLMSRHGVFWVRLVHRCYTLPLTFVPASVSCSGRWQNYRCLVSTTDNSLTLHQVECYHKFIMLHCICVTKSLYIEAWVCREMVVTLDTCSQHLHRRWFGF